MIVGTEWLIEATGCEPDALRDENAIRSIMSSVIDDLGLRSIGSVWHKFDGEGGVTGLIALTESHLACHTYPEYGTATFNLYCCRSRPEWNWKGELKAALEAAEVSVTRIERGTLESQGTEAVQNLRSEIPDLRFEIAGGQQ
ncbi:MAG: adenosylmethionine decarboxylase [Pyrinomonadaceae bacterium]